MSFLSTGVTAGMVICAFFITVILISQGADGWRHAWVYLGTATLLVSLLGVLTLKDRPAGSFPAASSAVSSLTHAWSQVARNRTIIGLSLVYFLFGFYQIYATFFKDYLRKGLGRVRVRFLCSSARS